MENSLVEQLFITFDTIKKRDENWWEYRLARELQSILWYGQRRNFIEVITKAKIACEGGGSAVFDHFVDVSKMVDIGSSSQREVVDENYQPKKICFTSSSFPNVS